MALRVVKKLQERTDLDDPVDFEKNIRNFTMDSEL